MNKDIYVILAGVAEGKMDAFGELYDMLSVRIFNYARSITNSKEIAEDVTHDVFLLVLKHATRIAKMDKPVAYIMMVTRNQSFDLLKRSKRITATLVDVSEISAVSTFQDQLLIEDAFSRLPVNQRETVYLHYICGFTQREVSRIMNAPLVTVKWRCRKALSDLHAYFNQDKEDDLNEVTRCDNL